VGTLASIPPVILASASPRRAELLTAAGVAFEVLAVEVDERPFGGETAVDYVARVAAGKARACPVAKNVVVLAADTVVVVDGRILGKPADDADAARMLRLLSGRGHDVLTGVAVRRGGEVAVAVESTAVTFSPLSAADVAWYVASGEPTGKAGAYGIQGLASRFVERVAGSYSNVVGLPVALVCRMLAEVASGS
jgi:septum formation protein